MKKESVASGTRRRERAALRYSAVIAAVSGVTTAVMYLHPGLPAAQGEVRSASGISCPDWTRPAGDKYQCYAQLAAHEREGVDYRRSSDDRHSAVAVIAIHGGKIEPGTSTLADELAGTRFSKYTFEGIRATGSNHDLHITSTNFDDPRALRLVAHSSRVLSFHGRGTAAPGDPACTTYVGGRDELHRHAVTLRLQRAGFSAREITSGPLAGSSTENIANKGSSGRGVQLEITYRQRQALYGQGSCGSRSSSRTAYLAALRSSM